ncbi:MAG: 16S rRNA (cytosine(1402)-N(4))-methyltransferase RsmH [Spirochaetales bacterium]|nr:16S rRNA (cytosine(1402)-N(4))-methyltransferase RsmH [Spirochaetales bacterium]
MSKLKKQLPKAKITHTPVLLGEVLDLLKPAAVGNKPASQSVMVDGTCGEGGHAEAFLSRYANLILLCVDADKEQIESARRRLKKYGSRVELFTMWFSDFFSDYHAYNRKLPDRILLDLGISRFHYEKSGRGFSFQRDEYLDMRISKELKQTAYDIVNKAVEQELVNILREYGEERFAYAIARAICRERKSKPVRTSVQLAQIVSNAVPRQSSKRRIHPATKTFQALRIAVNGELNELEKGLAAGFTLLKKGGRFAVISFHSLEDRIVKRFFKSKNKSCTCPPEWPICQCRGEKELILLTKKPITPGDTEVRANPAARSAKLRVVEKCA